MGLKRRTDGRVRGRSAGGRGQGAYKISYVLVSLPAVCLNMLVKVIYAIIRIYINIIRIYISRMLLLESIFHVGFIVL